jgi:hypothetical protein
MSAYVTIFSVEAWLTAGHPIPWIAPPSFGEAALKNGARTGPNDEGARKLSRNVGNENSNASIRIVDSLAYNCVSDIWAAIQMVKRWATGKHSRTV